MPTPRSFEQCKKWLRRNFPLKNKSCNIRLVSSKTIIKWIKFDRVRGHKDGDDYHGHCRYETCLDGSRQYTLYINKEDDPRGQIETLLHEYAHALQFQVPHGADDYHGDVFKKYHNRIKNKWAKCIET